MEHGVVAWQASLGGAFRKRSSLEADTEVLAREEDHKKCFEADSGRGTKLGATFSLVCRIMPLICKFSPWKSSKRTLLDK